MKSEVLNIEWHMIEPWAKIKYDKCITFATSFSKSLHFQHLLSKSSVNDWPFKVSKKVISSNGIITSFLKSPSLSLWTYLMGFTSYRLHSFFPESAAISFLVVMKYISLNITKNLTCFDGPKLKSSKIKITKSVFYLLRMDFF